MSKITAGELSKILKEHKRWLDTDEKEGKRAFLYRADLSGADLWKANLSRADLSGANLSGARLYDADLSNANLYRANLSGAWLHEANLSGAGLTLADLSDAKLGGILVREKYRAKLGGARYKTGADLSGAVLSGANLSGAVLSGANLSGADLSGANLSGAWLHEADLSGANPSGANWNDAKIEGAKGLPSYLQVIELPEWLDDFLFDTLDASYRPDYERASKSLEFTADKLKEYLGTYFPRSYAESFVIFSDIFSKQSIKDQFIKKGKISIMDFGSGTGGNLIGLLEAIEENIKEQIDIKIVSIDGNKNALDYQESILNTFEEITNKRIKFIKEEQRIIKTSDIYNIPNKLDEEGFDVIMTFKCLSELAKDCPQDCEIYFKFAELASGIMSEFSFLIILDVTDKFPDRLGGKFIPVVLNQHLNFFESRYNTLRTIIPVPCFTYAAKCDQECFTQQLFFINHSKLRNYYNKSKVAYRVLVTEKVYKSLNLKIDDNVTYVTNITKWADGGRPNAFSCFHSNYNIYCSQVDSFKLL